MTDIKKVQAKHEQNGRGGFVLFILLAAAFAMAEMSVPLAVCTFVAGRFLGEFSFSQRLKELHVKLKEVHSTIDQRVQAHIQQYMQARTQVDIAVHQSATQACSAIAEADAEQDDPGVIWGDTERGRLMGMKPGLGNAVALSPWDIPKDEE